MVENYYKKFQVRSAKFRVQISIERESRMGSIAYAVYDKTKIDKTISGHLNAVGRDSRVHFSWSYFRSKAFRISSLKYSSNDSKVFFNFGYWVKITRKLFEKCLSILEPRVKDKELWTLITIIKYYSPYIIVEIDYQENLINEYFEKFAYEIKKTSYRVK